MTRAESEPKSIYNLDDITVKRRLLSAIGALRGLHTIQIKKIRPTRSSKANSYYWAAVVTPFRDWLREEYGDSKIDSEQAHEMLKVKILGLDEKYVEDKKEVLRLIPRSKTLSTEEFSKYIRECSEWLEEFCGIVVLSSDDYYGRTELGANIK